MPTILKSDIGLEDDKADNDESGGIKHAFVEGLDELSFTENDGQIPNC